MIGKLICYNFMAGFLGFSHFHSFISSNAGKNREGSSMIQICSIVGTNG